MQTFSGNTAVITGAASGIGYALAQECAQLDMRIVLADVAEAPLARAEAELAGRGAQVLAVPTDVSRRADVEALADRAFAAFGAVHLLFNNAGVAAGGSPWEATWNDWEWVLGVNLWGVLHGVKVFTPRLLAQNTECHIVNTASGAGLTAGGFSAPYSVSKHAVVALSESLYFALRQRQSLVHVSVLCPSLVRTAINQTERNRPSALHNPPPPSSPESDARMQAGRVAFEALLASSMDPRQAARITLDAIRANQFYVLTDPAWLDVVRLRTDKILSLQDPVDPTPRIAQLLARTP